MASPSSCLLRRNGSVRQQNKSGKSSAESEGSPDELLMTRKKPGVLNDNLQRQRSQSNSGEGDRESREAKKPAQNIRKERAKKLKGSDNHKVYHFCTQCM